MRKVILSIAIFLTAVCYGQENIGTPYSIYSIGLIPENIGPYTAMGGVSAAMRDANNINFLNPASYTALDSNRFYFQFGMTGEYVHISTHKESSNYRVAQNASINIAMRLYKNLYGSFGFNERTDIGYDLLYTDRIPNTDGLQAIEYSQHIQGEGGLNDLYLGLAWRYKNLSVGLNSSVIFGKIEKRQTLQAMLPNSYYIRSSDNKRVTDVLFTAGLQYLFKLSPKSRLTLGSSFNFGTDLYTKREYVSYKVNTGSGSSTTLDDRTLEKGSIKYPFHITSGFNYDYKDRWNLAGDYTFMQMSAYKEFGESSKFQDYHKGAMGISYLPERFGRFWWQRNKYMLGTYIVRSHLDLKNTSVNTYAVTLGTQIPVMTLRSELLLGVALDFGLRGTEKNGLIQEKFAKLRVNIAFKERWFVKQKIN